MSKRRDELKALLAGGPAADGTGKAELPARDEAGPAGGAAEPARERAASGAVKAMGLALGNLRAGAEEARSLRDALARGEQVVELDPAAIEPAFLADRLARAGDGDEGFEALKASIAATGQAVPVLVRPHPDAAKARAGLFQAAYGHRRIAATLALGAKVRAVVRQLTDEELVLAQGKENSERRDLSFIERAFFGQALVRHGFERRTAEAALGIHKTEMTRLLQVADAIPLQVAIAIGPAPKVGRERWQVLAEFLKSEAGQVKAQEEIGLQRFRSEPSSDARFALMLARLSRRGAANGRGAAEEVKSGEGARIAALRRGAKAVTIEIRAKDFAEFVAAELPALHAAFLARPRAAEEDG